ncbi:MAG: TonB-dependent receptor, partial [Bacteroidales bacterium]|nr:TonB-dependent receptor [Bacteroidales bacterium]
NPDIKAQRSVQVVAATEYNFKLWRRPFKFTAEVYYKYLDNLISYNVENVKIVYSALNDAKGYATGIDLKWSGEFIEGLESWIALSLMKTSENIVNDSYYNSNNEEVKPGYLPRPTDQPFAVNLFFQDHFPGIPSFRIHLNFVFASGLPYSYPNGQRTYINNHGREVALRTSMYKRVDVGFSYMFLEQTRDRMKHKNKALRTIKNMGLFFEVFNLLGTSNVSSYKWFSIVGGRQTAVPDYLTGRLFNLKFLIEI